ncbi:MULTISPECIES: hypothetical protein [Streptomyces]|uniref:hypothetical protein n=1 Tax=Streptomyces scabiei TaxID=1930 RepID=UPI001B33A273|nr:MULTISPECIES: hypothetical protein [Streptomyces]MBP5888720.1 hypothetical protein [Streptomyces sp. LBUM 1487]MDW8478413.1 hypothetical protein [Streptomyces scabiei]
MKIVEPGTYDFDLEVTFPAAMKSTYRGSSGRITIKDSVEKDVLAERLAAETLTGLAGKVLTITRLELTPTSGPTVAEQAVIDYLDCIRVAAKHMDSCEACQNEQYCEVGEPILYHFELALDRYRRRESLLV